jgi:hypothetical protein
VQAAAPTSLSRLSTLKACYAMHLTGGVGPWHRSVARREQGEDAAAMQKGTRSNKTVQRSAVCAFEMACSGRIVYSNAPADFNRWAASLCA